MGSGGQSRRGWGRQAVSELGRPYVLRGWGLWPDTTKCISRILPAPCIGPFIYTLQPPVSADRNHSRKHLRLWTLLMKGSRLIYVQYAAGRLWSANMATKRGHSVLIGNIHQVHTGKNCCRNTAMHRRSDMLA